MFFRRTISAGLGALALVASADSCAAVGFTEVARAVPSFSYAGRSGLVAEDADGDGVADLVFAVQAGVTVLQVLGRPPAGSLEIKQSLIAGDFNQGRLVAWRRPGDLRFLLISYAGVVQEFGGWPLRPGRSFAVAPEVMGAVVADVDADGQDDLVLKTYTGLAVYRLSDAALEWQIPVPGYTLAVGQLDADAALEIVIDGTPGVVLDGATHASNWSYYDGFGAVIATGKFGPGGAGQFAAPNGYGAESFRVFSGGPNWAPSWDWVAPVYHADALAAADLEPDGRDEILFGDEQFGYLRVVDSASHLERFKIANPGYGVSSIVSADVTGEGTKDIAFSCASAGLNTTQIRIAAGDTGAVAYDYQTLSGPHRVVATGDFDNDGNRDFAIASAGPEPASVRIVDAATGALEWISSQQVFNANEPFYMSSRRILSTQLDDDPARELVLVGESGYDGRVLVLDGASHAVQLQVNGDGGSVLHDREVTDAALIDFDHDGVDDLAVASNASFNLPGPRIDVLSLENGGAPIAQLVVDTPGFQRISGVLVGQTDADAAPEIIAVSRGGLAAFDSATGTVDWSLATEGYTEAAALVPSGVSGAEIALVDSRGLLELHSAETRQLLRSIPIPADAYAVSALNGSVHELLVSAGGRMLRIDGATGLVLDESDYLGPELAHGNQLAVFPVGEDWRIAAGSLSGYFLDTLGKPSRLFYDGFE